MFRICKRLERMFGLAVACAELEKGAASRVLVRGSSWRWFSRGDKEREIEDVMRIQDKDV